MVENAKITVNTVKCINVFTSPSLKKVIQTVDQKARD